MSRPMTVLNDINVTRIGPHYTRDAEHENKHVAELLKVSLLAGRLFLRLIICSARKCSRESTWLYSVEVIFVSRLMSWTLWTTREAYANH